MPVIVLGLIDSGKINVLPIKIAVWGWDTKARTRPPCSFILYTLWAVQGDGEWGLQWAHNSPSLQLLLPHTSSLLQHESSTGCSPSGWTFCSMGSSLQTSAPSGHIHLLWCGVLNRLQGNTCSTMALSIGNRQICSSTWGTSSHSVFSDLGICRIASHTCTSSALTACGLFCSFLNVFSQKSHQLSWQDQLWPGEGPCWTWLDPALSGTGQPPGFHTELICCISLIANPFTPTSSANSTLKISNEHKSEIGSLGNFKKI